VLREAVRGRTQFERGATLVLDGKHAVRPDQRPHTEDSFHSGLSILAVDLLAQDADVLAGVARAGKGIHNLCMCSDATSPTTRTLGP
jgi:hypothetical protein